MTALGVSVSASWEPDLWGSVRRSVEAGVAGAQASADDLAAARLSIQSALAQDYLQLRYVDEQRELYADTIAAYAKALQLTQAQSRRRRGAALRRRAGRDAAQVGAGGRRRPRRRSAPSSSTRSRSSPAGRRRVQRWRRSRRPTA